MTRSWADVWAARQLDRQKASVLERLMEADGLDTGFGNVSETAWRQFSSRVAAALDATPRTRVFEVGCGAGAFLYPWHENGCRVGGLDQSGALIGFAGEAMPAGQWTLGDAAALDCADRWDIVLACGVFMYFPDHAYAAGVMACMARKATRAIAILDLPDLAKKEAALAFRRGTLGDAEYEAKYRGLDHLFFDREWMRTVLLESGATSVTIEDQDITGYQNSRFRFNAFARL
jgi:trans-aconitate methyltransferase